MVELEWWSALRPETRAWLIAHNGEMVPPAIVSEIVLAGGALHSGAWWEGESGPDGFFLSDAATDWVEAAANQE